MPTSSYHDEPTPDIHGCWYCVTTIADRLLARLCSIDDVICNLEEALCRGWLRSKAQACSDHRLVDPSEWPALQLVLRDWPDNWLIEVVHRETGEPLQANIYIWLPDCDRLWPAEMNNAQPAPACIAPPVAPPLPGPAPLTFKQRKKQVRFEATAWLNAKRDLEKRGRDYYKVPCMAYFAGHEPHLSEAEYYKAVMATGRIKRGPKLTPS